MKAQGAKTVRIPDKNERNIKLIRQFWHKKNPVLPGYKTK
jgi:hypothetical protein